MAYDPQRSIFWYADLLVMWKVIKTVFAWIFGLILFIGLWISSSPPSPEKVAEHKAWQEKVDARQAAEAKRIDDATPASWKSPGPAYPRMSPKDYREFKRREFREEFFRVTGSSPIESDYPAEIQNQRKSIPEEQPEFTAPPVVVEPSYAETGGEIDGEDQPTAPPAN